MSNTNVVINFNTQKRLILLIGGFIMFLLVVFFCIYLYRNNEFSFIYPSIAIIILIMLIPITKDVFFNKDKSGLILDTIGIEYRGTPNAKNIGKVKWTDINGIAQGKVLGIQQCFLRLKSPYNYTNYVNKDSLDLLVKNGLAINATELDINFDEMHQLIHSYFEKYHTDKI